MKVVHRAVAVADADMSIDDVWTGLIDDGDNAESIDGMRIHLVHNLVLLEHVLHNTDAFCLQFVVHLVQRSEILLKQLIDAETATGRFRFHHDSIPVLHKFLEILFGCLGKVQPLSANVFGEGGVEFCFVVEVVVGITVIENAGHSIVDTAGHIGCPLSVCKVIEFAQQIVVEPCTVLDTALHNVGQNAYGVLLRDLVDLTHGPEQLRIIHAGNTGQDKFQLSHGPLPLTAFCCHPAGGAG